ncbi:MAG TPA: branched-chain amino acid ABC transporter permease [Streptosporangiaceae bacterium]|nr:branched-chain amino acid ABC transporter permease [Streptosporangiaceae bacterium]
MNTIVPAIGFGIVTASILAVAGVGFTLQFGVTNILNLAYGDIMTAAAFVAYLVTSAGLNVWLALVAGAAFGSVFSVLLNRCIYTPFVRRGTRLFGMIIVTIAVSLMVQNGLLAIFGASFFSLKMPHPSSVHIAGMVFTTVQLAIIAIAVVAMLLIHLLLRYTKLGKAMRATAADPDLARNCGIATDRVVDLAWAISGALCGLAGVILVMNVTAFTETTGSQFLIPIVAVAVLGGIGQPYGAMLGALVIGITSEVAAAIFNPEYKDVVAFVILVIVLLARPQGILSEVATRKEVAA